MRSFQDEKVRRVVENNRRRYVLATATATHRVRVHVYCWREQKECGGITTQAP